jgi:hypothetical protein
MRLIAKRSNRGPEDPDAYWRRRFFILGGGLAVLMVLAWMFGGGGPSKQSSKEAAAHAVAAAREANSPLPAAALGSPSPLPSASPSPSASPVQSALAGTSPGSPSAAASASASASPTASARACARNGIVLSLFPSEPDYQSQQSPKFDIYAVSTSSKPCELSYGPGSVRVVVTEHGQVVWDSSSCKTHEATSMVSFSQGVPQEISLSWDRQSTSCGASAKVRPGTLQVDASADGHWTPVRSFNIRPMAKGATVSGEH